MPNVWQDHPPRHPNLGVGVFLVFLLEMAQRKTLTEVAIVFKVMIYCISVTKFCV